MKRIAVIAHGLSGGGAERVASTIANYLAAKGHRVTFVALYSNERVYSLDERIEYTFIETSSKNTILRLVERSGKLKKVLKKFKTDVAFSFTTDELIPLIFSRIKVIPSLRIDPKITETVFIRAKIRRFVYNFSHRVIFQTEEARDFFGKRIRKRGVVIGNPLKENLPFWNEDNHRKVFLTACRITKQKNIPMLINAFVRFHELFPEYILEVYGDGEPKEYKEAMEKLANDKGAGEYIFFKGHSSDIHNIMCNSEAFFLTSNYEGLSNSMLEAMAIGIPCVCTDCPPGGAKAYIEHNKSGMLVPVGGEDELFEAMCAIAQSAEFRHMLSENSKYVRDKLEKNTICSMWEELI